MTRRDFFEWMAYGVVLNAAGIFVPPPLKSYFFFQSPNRNRIVTIDEFNEWSHRTWSKCLAEAESLYGPCDEAIVSIREAR